MIKLSNEKISTGYLPVNPTKQQLEKLNIEQLFLIAKRKKKKGLKQLLLNYLEGVSLL